MKKGVKIIASKRGQEVFGMSFGMIFSILLIVFFIVIAFIVINSFLKTQRCVQVGLFITDFKNEIKAGFNSPKEDNIFTGKLPSNIEDVCFSNASKLIGLKDKISQDIGIWYGKDANMFFYPSSNACGAGYAKVDYLDIEKIAGDSNIRCFEVKNGQVSIRVIKGLNEQLVSLG